MWPWPALWILCNICKGMSQVTWIYNSGRHYKFGQNYIKFRPKFRTRVSDFRIRPQFRHFLVYNELEKEKSNVKYILQLKKINKKNVYLAPKQKRENFYYDNLLKNLLKGFVRIFVFRLNFGFRPDFRLSGRVSDLCFGFLDSAIFSENFGHMYSMYVWCQMYDYVW